MTAPRTEAWAVVSASGAIVPTRISTVKKDLTIGDREKIVRVLILETKHKAKPGGRLNLNTSTAYEECLAILKERPWKKTEEEAFEKLFTKAGRRGDYFKTKLEWLQTERTSEIYRKIWVLYQTYQSPGGKWAGEGTRYTPSLLKVIHDKAWEEPLEDRW